MINIILFYLAKVHMIQLILQRDRFSLLGFFHFYYALLKCSQTLILYINMSRIEHMKWLPVWQLGFYLSGADFKFSFWTLFLFLFFFTFHFSPPTESCCVERIREKSVWHVTFVDWRIFKAIYSTRKCRLFDRKKNST